MSATNTTNELITINLKRDWCSEEGGDQVADVRIRDGQLEVCREVRVTRYLDGRPVSSGVELRWSPGGEWAQKRFS